MWGLVTKITLAFTLDYTGVFLSKSGFGVVVGRYVGRFLHITPKSLKVDLYLYIHTYINIHIRIYDYIYILWGSKCNRVIGY